MLVQNAPDGRHSECSGGAAEGSETGLTFIVECAAAAAAENGVEYKAQGSSVFCLVPHNVRVWIIQINTAMSPFVRARRKRWESDRALNAPRPAPALAFYYLLSDIAPCLS